MLNVWISKVGIDVVWEVGIELGGIGAVVRRGLSLFRLLLKARTLLDGPPRVPTSTSL
jgi:hypothetical protein